MENNQKLAGNTAKYVKYGIVAAVVIAVAILGIFLIGGAGGKNVSADQAISHISSEATNGAEGVVPMNNEQSMELIGQAVAKHVVINLTNNTMLDGKVIAREQRKISDENNFLTNGRGV